MKLKSILSALLISVASIAYAAEYTKISDIKYRDTTDEYTAKQCRLDISYVKGSHGKPVIVWFHGGGLTSGDKGTPNELLQKDYIVVSVQYRMMQHTAITDIIDDAAAAVAWTFRNITKFGGDTTSIYVAGHSAGGYLTDMVGLDKTYLSKYGIDADRIAGLVPFSGQAITHFEYRKQNGLSPLFPTIDNTAPIAHVRKNCPPILIISGDREKELFGRYEEQAYFWRLFKLAGHTDATLYELDGFDHGSMCHPGYLLLLDFIKKHESDK